MTEALAPYSADPNRPSWQLSVAECAELVGLPLHRVLSELDFGLRVRNDIVVPLRQRG